MHNSLSISMTVNFFNNLLTGIVKAPNPGPISITCSSFFSFRKDMIWLIIFLSIKKCCPSFLRFFFYV